MWLMWLKWSYQRHDGWPIWDCEWKPQDWQPRQPSRPLGSARLNNQQQSTLIVEMIVWVADTVGILQCYSIQLAKFWNMIGQIFKTELDNIVKCLQCELWLVWQHMCDSNFHPTSILLLLCYDHMLQSILSFCLSLSLSLPYTLLLGPLPLLSILHTTLPLQPQLCMHHSPCLIHALWAPLMHTSPCLLLIYHHTFCAQLPASIQVYYHAPYTCLSSISTGHFPCSMVDLTSWAIK